MFQTPKIPLYLCDHASRVAVDVPMEKLHQSFSPLSIGAAEMAKASINPGNSGTDHFRGNLPCALIIRGVRSRGDSPNAGKKNRRCKRAIVNLRSSYAKRKRLTAVSCPITLVS